MGDHSGAPLGAQNMASKMTHCYSAQLSRSLEVFGSRSEHPETGPKWIGIGLRRFVGTGPGVFGLVSCGLGAEGPKSTIPGRILKSFRGPLSSAEVIVAAKR